MSSKPLVIFDCDGVLVDSEPISLGTLREVLAEDGLLLSEDDTRRRFLGRSIAKMVKVIEQEYGLSIGDDLEERMRARLYARFRAELKPTQGIVSAWDALKAAGFSWCVASSSKPERIRLSLEVTGLLPRFCPPLYSATMVKNGKPAPDLFLYAAENMGRNPEDCIVIEDSPAGIEAAKAAGMKAFAYLGGSHALAVDHRQEIARLEPDLMFDAMDELVQRIREAGEEQG